MKVDSDDNACERAGPGKAETVFRGSLLSDRYVDPLGPDDLAAFAAPLR